MINKLNQKCSLTTKQGSDANLQLILPTIISHCTRIILLSGKEKLLLSYDKQTQVQPYFGNIGRFNSRPLQYNEYQNWIFQWSESNDFDWFPSAYKSFIYTIVLSIKYTIALCLKKKTMCIPLFKNNLLLKNC